MTVYLRCFHRFTVGIDNLSVFNLALSLSVVTWARVYGKLPKAIVGWLELARITFCRENKYIIKIEPQKRRLGISQEKQVQFLPMQLDLQMNLPENSQI